MVKMFAYQWKLNLQQWPHGEFPKSADSGREDPGLDYRWFWTIYKPHTKVDGCSNTIPCSGTSLKGNGEGNPASGQTSSREHGCSLWREEEMATKKMWGLETEGERWSDCSVAESWENGHSPSRCDSAFPAGLQTRPVRAGVSVPVIGAFSLGGVRLDLFSMFALDKWCLRGKVL